MILICKAEMCIRDRAKDDPAKRPARDFGRELKFAAPLTVEGEYFFDGEGFSFKGTATTRLDSECALCGKPFIEELTFDFDERFLREPEPDSECYGYTGRCV